MSSPMIKRIFGFLSAIAFLLLFSVFTISYFCFSTAGRVRLHVDRERSVGADREAFVLRPDRVSLDLVRFEEVLRIVQRERPEALDGRHLSLRKRDRVFFL